MNEDKGPIVEKANTVAEKPFKLLSEQPFVVLKTSYAFWLHNNNKITPLNPTGAKISPLIARDNNGQFEIYKDGGWVGVNKNEYWYDLKDKEGKVVLKDNGQPKRAFYFDTFYEYPVEFKDSVEMETWSKEAKKMQVISTDKARIRVKQTLNKRIQEYLKDPRNKDTYMSITYDKDAMPADMYGVRYNV